MMVLYRPSTKRSTAVGCVSSFEEIPVQGRSSSSRLALSPGQSSQRFAAGPRRSADTAIIVLRELVPLVEALITEHQLRRAS
jgi:hypothetical protein